MRGYRCAICKTNPEWRIVKTLFFSTSIFCTLSVPDLSLTLKADVDPRSRTSCTYLTAPDTDAFGLPRFGSEIEKRSGMQCGVKVAAAPGAGGNPCTLVRVANFPELSRELDGYVQPSI